MTYHDSAARVMPVNASNCPIIFLFVALMLAVGVMLYLNIYMYAQAVNIQVIFYMFDLV